MYNWTAEIYERFVLEIKELRYSPSALKECRVRIGADACGVLLSSYLTENQPFPEYKNTQVHFDYSNIRPKGALISGGFKAPGPDGLRSSLTKIEAWLDKITANGEVKLRPIDVYSITMHIADAVLSGGVRRSSTICIFSKDDQDMLMAKTGNWFVENPHFGRSNNSVLLKRDEVTKEEFAKLIAASKQSGDPGFIFTDSLDTLFNPLTHSGL